MKQGVAPGLVIPFALDLSRRSLLNPGGCDQRVSNGGLMDEQNKNLLLAVVLSLGVIIIWAILFPPEQLPTDTELPAEVSATGDELLPSGIATGDDPFVPADDPGTGETPVAQAEANEAVEAARVPIETPRLSGSLSLQGGRIDDLSLNDYQEELADESDLVRLLSPAGSAAPYYAFHAWVGRGASGEVPVPNRNTLWELESGSSLTPDSPVTLAWDNGAGLIFRKTISIDEDYLFSVAQSVENTTGAPVVLSPYAMVIRDGEPETVGFFILHEGVVRMSDGELEEIDYSDLPDLTRDESVIDVAENGWIGFTDKYWMTTLIPEPGTGFRSNARAQGSLLILETTYDPVTIDAGSTLTAETSLFAGAKEWEAIRGYQTEKSVDGFVDSIDWGWFYFLTKPIFIALHWLNGVIGNMGWAIIALTFLIKAILLPLAYKSYVSMAKMKELQPEMEKLKERAGDNREEMQKGMLKLYRENKVNPASGCLPILLQIPIFFSLYKVIFVTIELRHAPWFGWIKDLSAPDPSSFVNLFGILPWGAPDPNTLVGILAIGILPIILGISMWLQQKLNPAPTDPTQKMIFAWLPWVFMFMLGGFASGLVVYWIANNVLTFAQQYTIMRSQGVKPNVFGNIRESFKRKTDKEAK